MSVAGSTRPWLYMDAHPFPHIRELIEQHDGCSLDGVQSVDVGALTREELPEGEYMRHSLTGEKFCNVEFSDRWLCFHWIENGSVQVKETQK